jgi:hypothetical protein
LFTQRQHNATLHPYEGASAAKLFNRIAAFLDRRERIVGGLKKKKTAGIRGPSG